MKLVGVILFVVAAVVVYLIYVSSTGVEDQGEPQTQKGNPPSPPSRPQRLPPQVEELPDKAIEALAEWLKGGLAKTNIPASVRVEERRLIGPDVQAAVGLVTQNLAVPLFRNGSFCCILALAENGEGRDVLSVRDIDLGQDAVQAIRSEISHFSQVESERVTTSTTYNGGLTPVASFARSS